MLNTIDGGPVNGGSFSLIISHAARHEGYISVEIDHNLNMPH